MIAAAEIRHGGDRVGELLARRGVRFLFTLCGGHISPILVGAKARGVRVVDVRHEATAVFAADAVARLSGVPGVAAVTAGPGGTNTITAIKNAQLAQSPLVLLGGATATILEGRGSLQDIDQIALFSPHVKWAVSVRRVRELVPTIERAFEVATSGTPGPVFVECPVDLLYPQELVASWYVRGRARGLQQRALEWYLAWHVRRLFAGSATPPRVDDAVAPAAARAGSGDLRRAASLLSKARRPVLLVGSQATLEAGEVASLAAAVGRLGIPTYLSGMARGLLGSGHPLQLLHQRRKALREADVVLLAGVPCDFRLDYGRHLGRARVIAVNRNPEELVKNRRPQLPILADAGGFLRALADRVQLQPEEWLATLRRRDEERETEIEATAGEPTEGVNPLALCRRIDAQLPEDSVLVADGGDFVGTASYIVHPRRPLSWLDPGVFGTLGVGAGFAIGAKLCRPESEVWILYGDGSVGYSLTELDSFVRHSLPVIAVVGNDACWMQIAREQVEVLGDDVGCRLARTDYHRVAEGFGARGLLLDDPGATDEVLAAAREACCGGSPVLVNAHLGKTDFRKGSISL